MDDAAKKNMITAYIEAYNRFDVEGMLQHLHEHVVFHNIANGEVQLTIAGKENFRQQAEQAKAWFSEREQRITQWAVADDQVEIGIDYAAVVAVALPNGLQPSDVLHLQGKSIFQFQGDQITLIEDIS